MSRAVSHFVGRLLTGLTFGKRGGPVYARLYDKTREADPEALIRDRWTAALGRPVAEDATVWRVEFELRPEFLRTLADGDEHITVEPRDVLEFHLDAIWEHLTTSWLVLRDPRSASRIARCRTQPWWKQLSEAGSLCGHPGAGSGLTRMRRGSVDPDPLLRQLAGVLAAFAARRDDQSLDGCLEALGDHLRRGGDGEASFAAAVERARLRMPLAAMTREAAEDNVAAERAFDMGLDLTGWLEAA